MSFVNLSLLTLGGLFVAVPIVLHLAMRPKPKHQVFPALRFLKQRQATNRRQLQLRQALLLLLRCLIILVLALALARPGVASAALGSWLVVGCLSLLLLLACMLIAIAAVQRRGWPLLTILSIVGVALALGLVQTGLAIVRNQPSVLLGDQKAAVAAAVVVDASPRMELRYENKSRLERAREVAEWLVKQFPKDSQVAIVDELPPRFSVDLGAAGTALAALDTDFVTSPWGQLIQETLDLLETSNHPRKELYILSDLTAATWGQLNQPGAPLAQRLAGSPHVSVHVIDLGVREPQNLAVADLQLSQNSLTPGSKLQVRTRLSRQGGTADCTAQLYLEAPAAELPLLVDGQLQSPAATLRGRQSVPLSDEQDQWVTFSVASLPYGTHHGYVNVEGADGLAVDDRRFLTVHVRAPWSILLVAGQGAEPYLVSEQLAPLEFRQQQRAKFDCQVITAAELNSARLDDYAAVGLLDPPPLDDAVWRRLTQYVQRGGGVAIVLGRNAKSASQFNSASAAKLLPAPLQRIWVDRDGLVVAPRDYSHPVVSVMGDSASTVPWESMPVFRHWVVGPMREQSQVVLELSSNKPLLLERSLGAGRVIMMTTPATDADDRARPAWNLLPTSLESWPFMILIDRLFLYLVQTSDAQLNYLAGQTARLPVDAAPGERLTLLTPRGTFQELAAEQQEIVVPFTDVPGIYRLRTDPESTSAGGFSVNLPGAATRLDRIPIQQLDAQLGKDRYQLATTEDQIVRDIDQARIGKEFYPFLLPLLAILMALEYVMANRFYPRRTRAPATAPNGRGLEMTNAS